MSQKTELRDEILALHEKGYSKTEIAAIVQCSVVTVRKYVPKQDRVYSDFNQPTKAEMEVLSLMVQGLNSRGIAKRRLVSPRTIESQISCLYAKSESNNHTQVINWGVQHGYCQYPDRTDFRQDDRQETINAAIAAIDQLLLAESDQIQLEIAAMISARLKLTREMAIARIQAIAQ